MEINDKSKIPYEVPIIINNKSRKTKENADHKKEIFNLKQSYSNDDYISNEIKKPNKREIYYTNNDYSVNNKMYKPKYFIPGKIHEPESIPPQAEISDFTVKDDFLVPINLNNLCFKKKIKKIYSKRKKSNKTYFYRNIKNEILTNELISKKSHVIKKDNSIKSDNTLVTQNLFRSLKNKSNENSKAAYISRNN